MKRIKKILKRINKAQLMGIIVALVIALLSFLLIKDNELLYFLLSIAFIIGGFPFFISLIMESRSTTEKNEMFLEFSRNLVESVKSGTPISKSILNIKKKDYGKLSPYVDKLGNQIALGIPLQTALYTFARDVKSKTITRAVNIISESEKAGGKIEDTLEAVANSVAQIDKLKKERKAAMSNLIFQGYIIFLIFIVIMLVMEFKVLPIASELGSDMSGIETPSGVGSGFAGFVGGEKTSAEDLAQPFFWLLMAQGLFAGLVIGKLSEGSVKSGIKHSFILVIIAVIISTGARLILG